MRTNLDPSLTLSQLSALAGTLGECAHANAAFAAVAAAADTHPGHRLFTVMACDIDTMQVQRLYSSNPSAYPPGSVKKKRDSKWGERVLRQGTPFIGHSAGDIREHFDDHEVIIGLGLESVLNMPIRSAGRTLGTMNLLHEAGYYSAQDLALARLFSGLMVGPMLAVEKAAD